MTLTARPPHPGAVGPGGDDIPHTPSGAGRGPALHQYRTPFPDRPEKRRRRAPREGGTGRSEGFSGRLALVRERLAAQVIDGLLPLRVPLVRRAALDRHVRLDPLPMPLLARRGQVLAGGQIETVAVLQRQKRADRPVAPGALPENRGTHVVAQGGREDLTDP